MTVTATETPDMAATPRKIHSLSVMPAVRDFANDLAIDQTIRTRRKISMTTVITAALALAKTDPDRFADLIDHPERVAEIIDQPVSEGADDERD